jgi:hypothetical protein
MTQNSRSLASRETPNPPTWRAKCRSGFATLPPEPLRQQPAVVLLWGRPLASWLFAPGERGGHDDLRGLDRLSVIPYVHRRTELYCAQACLALAFSFFDRESLPPRTRYLPGPFIAQGRVVTMRPVARQVAPRWLKPYTTSRALMARSS